MDEYIEREALIKQLEIAFDKEGKRADEYAERNLSDSSMKYGHGQFCYFVAKTMVQDAPSADVVEVRHGEWKGCECSVCGKVSPTVHLDVENEYKIRKTPYCPNCGAKMDGKERTSNE